MTSEKIFVSPDELQQVQPGTGQPAPVPPKLRSPVPRAARIGLWFLVPFLPVVAIVAGILRIAFRSQPKNVRLAWVSFLSTLLIVSGLIWSAGAVAVVATTAPIPAFINNGLPDLDERVDYPSLPSGAALTSSEVSERLKPLVVVISPAVKLAMSHREVAGNEFGAGALLYADKAGFLMATARHVVGSGKDVMVATASGIWSSATVVATATDLDLALVWVVRHSGTSEFAQPIAKARDGEAVFVIGHPEGMRFTLSTGIVSSIRDAAVQVSAAISPGNSGGPVYDDHGNLIAIVSSKFDHNIDANAESIGFAARADVVLDSSRWSFSGDGKKLLDRYRKAVAARQSAAGKE